MKNAFQEIITWIATLPLWEQAAFDSVLLEKVPNDEELDNLVNLLLSQYDLSETEVETPALKYQEYMIDQVECLPYTLNKIANLRNINALVPDQTLTFGQNMTAVFGVNGSGKSGYARVLGSAGFTRGDEEIIPDISQPFDPDSSQSVDIELECEGEFIPIKYEVGSLCPQLSSFYVFDSTSVLVHLTKENTISFSPTGLSYLPKFAELTDLVRDRLTQLLTSRNRENIYTVLFHGETKTNLIISKLGQEADLEMLSSLAKIEPTEFEEYKLTKSRVSTIETQGISSQVQQLTKEKDDILTLLSQINLIQNYWEEKSIQTINAEIQEYLGYLVAANELGLENFKSGELRSVGTDEWLEFIKSAKTLSNIEGTDEEEYPNQTSHCLLCQQPLTEDAKALIQQLWSYLASETQKHLNDSQKRLNERKQHIKNIDVEIFQDQHSVFRLVQKRKPELSSTPWHK